MRAGVGTQAFGSTLQVKLGGRVSMWQEPGVTERGWDHRKGSRNATCCSPHEAGPACRGLPVRGPGPTLQRLSKPTQLWLFLMMEADSSPSKKR